MEETPGEVVEKKLPIRLYERSKKTFIWYFFSFHVLLMSYLLIITFVASGILCGIDKHISYIDSLFTCTSAITSTGLIVVDTASLSVVAQVLIFFLIILGNGILLSLIPLVKRIFLSYLPKLRAKNNNESEKLYAKVQIRACIYIMIVVMIYFTYCVLIGVCIFLTMGLDPDYVYVVHEKYNNNSNWWFSIFNSVSIISNAGFSLLPDSLVSLRKLFVPIATDAWLILAGNCFFPIFLRMIFSALYFFFPNDKAITLIYRYPRLVYTHLFPNWNTLQLFLVLTVLNIAQFALALGLDWNEDILNGLNTWQRIYNEALQAISTKHAGVNSLEIQEASIAVIILYIGCMYLSAYPITISIRGSKIEDKNAASHYIQNMFFSDLSIVFLGILIVAIIENDHLKDHPTDYTALKIIFEVVSAYGTVGLTLGYRNVKVSFSAGIYTGSKVIILIIMLLGKLRTLPNVDDPAFTGKVSLEDFQNQWNEIVHNKKKEKN